MLELKYYCLELDLNHWSLELEQKNLSYKY